MFGFGPDRNRKWRMTDMHPQERQPDPVHTGNAGVDGFTVLARAIPGIPESRPPVDDVVTTEPTTEY